MQVTRPTPAGRSRHLAALSGRERRLAASSTQSVSEGGLTSRIVGFSPPVSVGLVMEPNLLPCRDTRRVETWTFRRVEAPVNTQQRCQLEAGDLGR